MSDLIESKKQVSGDLLASTQDSFELMQRKAKMLATTSIVPDRFRNNIGDIVVACDMANRMGMSYLAVMQNLYIVYGQPAWSSQFMIACFNQCGRFGPLRYDVSGRGDEYGCVAKATIRETGTEVVGPRVTIKMAKDEGWFGKKGSKWQTMPELMLKYRAAAFLIRTTAPELTLGMYMQDEVEDFKGPPVEAMQVTTEPEPYVYTPDSEYKTDSGPSPIELLAHEMRDMAPTDDFSELKKRVAYAEISQGDRDNLLYLIEQKEAAGKSKVSK